MHSLYAFRTALSTRTHRIRFQYLLLADSDFAGYIATRTYDSSRRTIEEPGASPGTEEEVRREICTRKGLVPTEAHRDLLTQSSGSTAVCYPYEGRHQTSAPTLPFDNTVSVNVPKLSHP